MEISLAEWLALGLFCLSAVRSVIELVAIPRWFDARKNTVSGTELNKLVARKRELENVTAKGFTVGLALVTGVSLAISFVASDVQISEISAIQTEMNDMASRLETLEAAMKDDDSE